MRSSIFILTYIWLSMLPLPAQNAAEVESLKKQLKEATADFEKAVQQHRQLMDSLTKRLEALEAPPGPKLPVTNTAPAPKEAAVSNAIPPAVVAAPEPPTAAPPRWSPSQPITIARTGPAYMNISFDALIDAGWSTESDVSRFLEQGDHDPLQRGFSLRNAEIALDGAVDPYLKGFANITMALDKEQETEVELEEAYLLTTALPGRLQAKAGQFFAEFGRQNPMHPHTWAFVDDPLVLVRFFGPDGLRNIGGQVSWLAPTPFYLEGFLGVFNGQGEQAFSFRNLGEEGPSGFRQFAGHPTLDRDLSGPGDLLFVPRLATSSDLTDTQTLLAGVSAAFGPNDTGSDARTEIYGLDLYWKWKSPTAHAGFPFVSFQSEALYRHFDAGADPSLGIPHETLRDWGFYSQALWGFKPRWVAGLRGEYLDGNPGEFDAIDRFRGERSRVSPDLTWYPSEFSKLRLQYNYDQGERFGSAHSVWLQAEFLLGAHGAHKF